MILVRSFIIVLISLSSLVLAAQSSGGLQIYGGYLAGLNSDKDFTPEGVRGAYHIGADARLLGGDLYFLFGGRYAKMAINGESFPGFSSDRSFSFSTGRFGLGFTILNITRKIRLRSKLLGSIHFISDIDDELVDNQRFIQFNDSFGGVTTGLGIDIGSFTIDLEYEKGVINMIFEEPDTKLDIISLSAGFKF